MDTPHRFSTPTDVSDLIDEMLEFLPMPYRERRRAMQRLFQGEYPRFLYRYTRFAPDDSQSVERLRNIIVDSQLWLASPLDFNDPFDMTAAIVFEGTDDQRHGFVDSTVERSVPGMAPMEKSRLVDAILADAQEVQSRLRQAFHCRMSQVGVVCFGRDPRSVLMWSHYAANHTGIALQFEPVRDVLELASAVPVSYADSYPVLNWLDGLEGGIRLTLRQKHRAWAYEGEFRCLRIRDAHTQLHFDARALTGVILGCRATEHTEQAVRLLLAERAARSAPALAVYRAEQHPRDYRLVLRRLD